MSLEDHQSRLSRLEAEVDFLRPTFNKFEISLSRLADDMHLLAVSVAKQESLHERLDAKDKEIIRLWDRVEKMEGESTKKESDELRGMIRKKDNWIREVVKSVAMILISLIAAHFGFKFI